MAQRAYQYDFGYEHNAVRKPRVEEQPQQSPKLRVIKNPGAVIRAEERAANMVALKVLALIAVNFLLLTAVCYSFVLKNETRNQLTAIENQYDVHKAQYEELNIRLTALAAGVDIDKIATEKLGLVKVTPENEVYLEKEKENKIVFSQSKE